MTGVRPGEAEAVEAAGVALGADQCCDPAKPSTMHVCIEWKAAQLAVAAARVARGDNR